MLNTHTRKLTLPRPNADTLTDYDGLDKGYPFMHHAILLKGDAMVKHGRIEKVWGHHKQHLSPIMGYVTKGIADALEDITLQPQACDVRGAKRFDSQQCVIAKCLNRSLHPQAVAVGRSLAYLVFNGLAIRFVVNQRSRKVVEEFDQRGRVVRAPIILGAVPKSQTLPALRKKGGTANIKTGLKRRAQKLNVRAVGGGIVMKVT